MNSLHLFLPCAGQVEPFLAAEIKRITQLADSEIRPMRGGVAVRASWRQAQQLNLHCRMAQRVLIELAYGPYRGEDELYELASDVAWEIWFTPRQTLKVDVTAQRSPLKSLNFAALRIKDAVVDRFRHKTGVRPSVDTHFPDVRVHLHLDAEYATVYLDTSGDPLFKRGWREDKGDAPLKETLAAAMIAASGWDPQSGQPLYDPCCGSGTVVVEAAQMACNMAAGLQRRFAFEKLLPFQSHVWQQLRSEAKAQETAPTAPIFGSDISHRMVDFSKRNAQRAGVAQAIELRGGDALQRMPPTQTAGVMLLNPPYGERIDAAGHAGRNLDERKQQGFVAREIADGADGGEFFSQLSAHWKKNYAGWTAWLLTPDLKLPGKMRLKESRRVPMWNGPIECRLFRFDLVAGAMQPRTDAPKPQQQAQ